MTKIRMNTELRNKLFNKIKNVFENEDTQEKEAFLQAREWVDEKYVINELPLLLVQYLQRLSHFACLEICFLCFFA